MVRSPSLVIGRAPEIWSWTSTAAFAEQAEGPVPSGLSAAELSLTDRFGRLAEQARRLRRAARRRRGDAHRHLAAARRARAGGDERLSRDETSAARRARCEAGKSEGFAAVCERRARALVMSLVHRCGGTTPADG